MTTATSTVTRRASFDLFQPVWRVLTSVRIAVFLIAALAAVGLAGVVIPQVPEAMRGNDAAVAAWVDSERGTFGPLTDPMYRLGLFEVFHATWFLVALGYLVLNVTTCVFNRWSPTFRNVFRPPVRVPDTFFARAHNRVTFAAVTPAAAAAALRRLRFGVREDAGAGATYIFADRFAWAQLATFLSHLALILFIAGGLITRLTGFKSEIVAGEGTTQPVFAVSSPRQLQVRIDEAIGRFGDRGNPLDFRTHLTIFRNGREVASGFTTVNDPLKYGGYRFHQAGFLPDGAELRIRELSTGNTLFHETFPMEETTAAPEITISDGSGNVLLDDVVAPTDFLPLASGTLVQAPGAARPIWVGITPKDDKRWQLFAFDPQASAGEAQLRIDQGETGALSGVNVRFDRVTSLPSALSRDLPDSGGGQVLAQLTDDASGDPTLLLTGPSRPAMSLAAGRPVVSGGYEYTFEGTRAFTGISVKRDHGAWFIWVATGMLLGGLAITFYVPRRRLWLKLTGNATQVAGLAEKSGGFERDMRILATRMGVPIPAELQEER